MDLNLKGKYALVTGGGAGIGAGCVTALAEEGCNIVIADRDIDTAAAFAEKIAAQKHVKAWALPVDVMNRQAITELFERIYREIGPLDILVNNAGGGWKTPSFQDVTDEDWVRSFNLVLNSAFYASKEFASRAIKEGRPGSIVNMVSKSAIMSSSKHNSPYASSKGGMIAMTRAMAKDLIEYGIRVNGVAPGYVQTEKTYPESDPRTAEKRKLLPSGEFAKPYDIGTLVAFLCSERSYQMIGTIVDITGGTLI